MKNFLTLFETINLSRHNFQQILKIAIFFIFFNKTFLKLVFFFLQLFVLLNKFIFSLRQLPGIHKCFPFIRSLHSLQIILLKLQLTILQVRSSQLFNSLLLERHSILVLLIDLTLSQVELRKLLLIFKSNLIEVLSALSQLLLNLRVEIFNRLQFALFLLQILLSL